MPRPSTAHSPLDRLLQPVNPPMVLHVQQGAHCGTHSGLPAAHSGAKPRLRDEAKENQILMQELATLLSSRSAVSLGTGKATGQAVLDTQSGCSRGSSLLPLDCNLELHPPVGGSRVLRGGDKEEYLLAVLRWVLPTGVGLPVVTLWLARGRESTYQDVSSRRHSSCRPGSTPAGQPPGNTGSLREGKPPQTACYALHRRSAHSSNNPGRPAVFSTWNRQLRKVERVAQITQLAGKGQSEMRSLAVCAMRAEPHPPCRTLQSPSM